MLLKFSTFSLADLKSSLHFQDFWHFVDIPKNPQSFHIICFTFCWPWRASTNSPPSTFHFLHFPRFSVIVVSKFHKFFEFSTFFICFTFATLLKFSAVWTPFCIFDAHTFKFRIFSRNFRQYLLDTSDIYYLRYPTWKIKAIFTENKLNPISSSHFSPAQSLSRPLRNLPSPSRTASSTSVISNT